MTAVTARTIRKTITTRTIVIANKTVFTVESLSPLASVSCVVFRMSVVIGYTR